MTPKYDVVPIARQFLYVREVPENKGLRVEAIQHWSGGQSGDSWCAEALWMWFDIAYQGAAPFERVQSCQALREMAESHGWIVEAPEPGDIVLSIDPAADHAHHVALVTAVEPLTAIAGNTSADGQSSNGDRVAEHYITAVNKVFVRVP